MAAPLLLPTVCSSKAVLCFFAQLHEYLTIVQDDIFFEYSIVVVVVVGALESRKAC